MVEGNVTSCRRMAGALCGRRGRCRARGRGLYHVRRGGESEWNTQACTARCGTLHNLLSLIRLPSLFVRSLMCKIVYTHHARLIVAHACCLLL